MREIVDKQTGEIIEYDEAKVKKLRPGVAYGARDLQYWSRFRSDNKTGSSSRNEERKQRKRALELSKLSGKPVKSFDGTIQFAKVKKKKRISKALTPYQLYKKRRQKLHQSRKRCK